MIDAIMEPTKHNLEDVGTRYEHYRQLLSLFEDGLAVMKYRLETSATTQEQRLEYANKAIMLACSVEMVTTQLNILSGYGKDAEYKLAKEVNAIEKDSQVWKQGRGSDLIGRRVGGYDERRG